MNTRQGHAVWVLWLLFAVNTMNFFDRQVISVVAEPIRKEWGLSDTAVGGLGTAFILLYAVIGVPLGRLADLWRRTRLLGLGVLVWSLMTFASGLANSFWMLFAARLGVGVGEATCAPCATSLIGDLYPPERRARALSVFMFGLPTGLALSSMLAGAVAHAYGWRSAFYLAGVPGLLLALLIGFVREPPCGSADGLAARAAPPDDSSPYRRVLRIPTMWWIIASGALHNFNMYALGLFLPSYLMRFHGVSVKESGFFTGIVFGAAGALGMFMGGLLSDRAIRARANGRMLVATAALALSIPTMLLALLQPKGALAPFLLFIIPSLMTMYVYYSTVYATVQDIIEPALRGTAMALYFFAMYLLGAALGPVGTGKVSDLLAKQAAAALGSATVTETARALGLRHAMFLVPALCVPLAWVLFMAARTVGADMRKLQERTKALNLTAEKRG